MANIPHIARERYNCTEVNIRNISKVLLSRGRFERLKIFLKSKDGDEAVRFGIAIRENMIDRVEKYIDRNEGTFTRVSFFFEVTVEKKCSKDSTIVRPRDTIDGRTINKEIAVIKISPLHLAIMCQNPVLVQMLITKSLEVDEKAGKNDITSRLLKRRTFVQFQSQDINQYSCVDQMIEGMNCFHIATMYHCQSLTTIIELVVGKVDIKRVLNERTTYLEHTPLHVAAKYGDSTTIRMLITNEANIECTDSRGFTPLHFAAKAGKETNAITLLENGANPNAIGNENTQYQMTPLHRARNSRMVEILLYYGADPSSRKTSSGKESGSWEKVSAFDVHLTRNPTAASKILDSCISDNGQELDSSDLLLVYDLELFRREANMTDDANCTEECHEMAVPSKLIYLQLKELLQHPLAEAYLHMKWELAKKFFQANVGLFFLFTVFLTSLTLLATSILKRCHDCGQQQQLNMTQTEWHCEPGNMSDVHFQLPDQILSCMEGETKVRRGAFWALFALSAVGLFFVALRESLQAVHSRSRYTKDRENILELLIVLLSTLYLGLLFGYASYGQHFGAFAIFLSWIGMALLIGRYPSIGIYIYMAAHVMKLLVHILLVYLTTLLAFSFGFHLLLPKSDIFENPLTSALKVLVMMVGEFDFEENYTWDEVQHSGSNVSAQILFVFFIFLTSITISNLIVGLTVNKTEELFREADVIRLQKAALNVMSLEDILVRKPSVVSYLPQQLRNQLLTVVQLFPHLDDISKWKGNVKKVCVKPFNRCHNKKIHAKERDRINASPLQSVYKDSNFPVYIYDESRDDIGTRLKFNLPGWIIHKTIDTIRNRMAFNNFDESLSKRSYTPKPSPMLNKRKLGAKSNSMATPQALHDACDKGYGHKSSHIQMQEIMPSSKVDGDREEGLTVPLV